MAGIMQLDGSTKVVGVIGWPVGHSLSPPMHNAAIAQLGLNWVYVPFAVRPDGLEQAIAGARALGIVGLNVTVPHKQGVAGLVDELDDIARNLGAVNTIVNRDGRLFGYNTDGDGFVRSLRQAGEPIEGRRAAVVGAGGAARSVVYALARSGAAAVTILNRTPQRAHQVAQLIRKHCEVPVYAFDLNTARARDAVSNADLLIDATPVGMFPKTDVPPVVPAEWLHGDHCVCDLVYTPRDTTLLKAARRKKARTIEGAGMLVYQGAIALELWSGTDAPVSAMHDALLGALQRRESTDEKGPEDDTNPRGQP